MPFFVKQGCFCTVFGDDKGWDKSLRLSRGFHVSTLPWPLHLLLGCVNLPLFPWAIRCMTWFLIMQLFRAANRVGTHSCHTASHMHDPLAKRWVLCFILCSWGVLNLSNKWANETLPLRPQFSFASTPADDFKKMGAAHLYFFQIWTSNHQNLLCKLISSTLATKCWHKRDISERIC